MGKKLGLLTFFRRHNVWQKMRLQEFRKWWMSREGDDGWRVVALVLCVKLLFLMLDSLPVFFLGDSIAYLAVALGHWIPADRSFTYGFLLRLCTASSHSLGSVVLAQTLASALSAILVVLICHRWVRLARWQLALLALFFAADPVQLVYERLIMAETFSLLVYLAILCLSAAYLLKRRWFLLIAIQFCAVAAISLRINLFPILAVNALLLPLLGWEYRRTWPALRTLSLHLTVSGVSLALLFSGYRAWHVHLMQRPYMKVSKDGFALAASWAPLLKPSDTDDPQLATILAKPELQLSDLENRDSQKYSKGYLAVTVQEALGSVRGNHLLQKTAIRAARRDPLALLRLGTQTYLLVWKKSFLEEKILRSLGGTKVIRADDLALLRTHYFLAADRLTHFRTFTQRYAQNLAIYYIALTSPVIVLALFFLTPLRFRKITFFIFLQTVGLLIAFSFLSTVPTPRYLHALFPLLLFATAFTLGRRPLSPCLPGPNAAKNIAES